MTVSTETFYIICSIIVLCGAVPAIYKRIRYKQEKSWYILIILLLIPLCLLTPNIYQIDSCELHTKRVLLFPKDDYRMGMHNYVVNNSDHTLFFEHLIYGDATLGETDIDMLIEPGTSYKAPTTKIHYLFEPSPDNITIKGDGEIRYRLSCDEPQWENYEEVE